jgi:hypothetical protein
MAAFEAAGEAWQEEPLTEVILAAAAPFVKFAKFTHREEREVGADWLWWWVDARGEAFGTLVQAKRLKGGPNRWDIDFNYRNGEQRRHLIQSGLDLRVPPMYALYLGTPSWRAGAFCAAETHVPGCESCEKRTVSLAPAIVLSTAHGAHDQEVSLMLEAGLPLETIADRRHSVAPVWDANLSEADEELKSFLDEPQTGARRVAQLVFERVCSIRWLAHSASTWTPLARGLESVFQSLPDDAGHYTRPYFPEILDGLRWEAPDYVLDVLADQPLPSWLTNRYAGVAILSC